MTGRKPQRGKRPTSSDVDLVGVRPVLEALRAGRRRLVRLELRAGRTGARIDEILALAAERGVPVERKRADPGPPDPDESIRDQGVRLLAGPLPEWDLADLVAGLRPGPRWLVLLDGVEDPQNVGAITRVAEAAGAGGLVLSHRRAPPAGSAWARASAGALEHLPVARVANLARALNHLKEQGFWVVGADADAGEDLFGLPDRILAGDLVFVLGAEGRGLRPAVAAQVDHRVRIPMWGQVGSLNVATAAAVVLFEARRRSRDRGEFPTDD